MRVVESKDTKHRLNAICDGVAPGVGVTEVSSFGQKLHDSQKHTRKILAMLKQKIELTQRTSDSKTVHSFPGVLGLDSKTVQRSIEYILARAFKRIFICKIWLRYSRKRAL